MSNIETQTLRYWNIARKARLGKDKAEVTASKIAWFINHPNGITAPRLRAKLFQLREENKKNVKVKSSPA